MRTQVRKFPRSLTLVARVAVIVVGAVGVAICFDWIPASIGGPHSIAAPAALSAGSAQHRGAGTTLRGVQPGRTACPGCAVIGSARKVRMVSAANGTSRCAHRANAAAVTASRDQGAAHADLLTLLDWHMDAANGYGFSLDGISCTPRTATAPMEDSEAYEILARFRDESGKAPVDQSPSIRHQGDPGSALPRANE